MNLAGVDLNLFVVFETVYAQGNLTRAAEILNTTQPAISNALARLRETFDDPLFVRVGRRMTPTPLAQNLAGPVRAALRQLRASIEQGSRFDPATAEKTFHIAIRDTACAQLMPGLLARIGAQSATIRVQCHEIDRGEIAAELAAGKLDCAVDIPELGRADLKSQPLIEDRYVCVLRRGHPLARRSLDVDALLSVGHVMVSSRRSGRGLVDIALGRLGRQADIHLRLTHFQPAFHVLMSSDLAMSAPLSLARKYDVEIRELPFAVPPLVSLLFWHRNADVDPANLWLRRLIASVSGDRGASPARRPGRCR